MKLRRQAGAIVAAGTASFVVLLFVGCETTGDPTQGGLFGWSETKARERQAQKQSRNASVEAELTRENAQGAALQSREDSASNSLAAAAALHTRTEQRLKEQHARIIGKVDRLEENSATDAAASRARAYRLKVNTIAAQTALPPQDRAERLHILEAEIDAALARASR